MHWVSTLYTLALTGAALYGVLGWLTLWFYWRHRHDEIPAVPPVADDAWPLVTVQLPIYNERYVVRQLIHAISTLDYPADRLQIQVLDDSTDDTTAIASNLVKQYQQLGLNISLLHRDTRMGYKAGALADGLEQATGEFVAIFDADFCPSADFLRQTIPYFTRTPRLGVVQARWGHTNKTNSFLTHAQAMAMDKYFTIDQWVRHSANLFPKFHGTAGVWRRACIDDAGGWEGDTVCEDLCLSTRAALKNWDFLLRTDLVAPAELPSTMSGYKLQQARWAKGSIQCLRKFGSAILHAQSHTISARTYALHAQAAYFTYPFLLCAILLQVPLLYTNYPFSAKLLIFSLIGLGQPLLIFISQQNLHAHRGWVNMRYFPMLFLLALGTVLSNSRAVCEALFTVGDNIFERTPKTGQHAPNRAQNYTKTKQDPILYAELSLALYTAVGTFFALLHQNIGGIFFMFSCTIGVAYVVYHQLYEQSAQRYKKSHYISLND